MGSFYRPLSQLLSLLDNSKCQCSVCVSAFVSGFLSLSYSLIKASSEKYTLRRLTGSRLTISRAFAGDRQGGGIIRLHVASRKNREIKEPREQE